MAHAGHLAGDAGVEDKMNNKIIYGIILLTIILVSGCTTSNPTQKGNPTGNIISNDAFIKIPISEISETAKHYSFDVNGKEVKYFLVKGSNGEIRSAFDACDVCGGYKGYRQEGTDMVCNNCGRVFSIDSIGTENRGGGCWPSFLENKIEGDHILISESELANGAFRF
mgnify:CR=1 FL=1